MSLHIDLRIHFLVKILREHIGKSINLTGTKSGISPIIGYVERTLAQTHNCVICLFQQFAVSALFQGNLITHLISIALSKNTVKENLSAFFRSFSLCH